MDLNELIQDTKKSLSPEKIDLEKSVKEEKKEDDEVVFNLEDSVGDEFKKGFVNVDPFFEEIADKVNLNNARLSKATEGLINLSIAQAEVIKGLEEKVNVLTDMVKAFSEAPAARKAVLSKGEAEDTVAVERFEKGSEEPNIGHTEEISKEPPKMFEYRDKISATLRKGIKDRSITDKYDIIRFQSVPVESDLNGVIDSLSHEASDYIHKAHPELKQL